MLLTVVSCGVAGGVAGCVTGGVTGGVTPPATPFSTVGITTILLLYSCTIITLHLLSQ